MPVSGDLVITIYLPPVGAIVEVKAPVANISLFSGENASIFGSTSSEKILVPRPRPPIYFFARSFDNSSGLIAFVARFILKILPWYDIMYNF